MSCCAKSWGFLKISRLFGKAHTQFWLRMSLNCEFSSIRDKLPASFEVKKAKEPSHGTNFVRKWRRSLLCPVLICLIILFGRTWFTIRSKNGGCVVKTKTFGFCEDKTRILLEYSNVSENQLHALASFFSESDEIGTIECMKPLSNGITCALTVSCSEKQEFQQRYESIVRNVDQCPVQDQSIVRKRELSLQEERYLSVPQSREFLINNIDDHEQNIPQTKTLEGQSKESCESLAHFLSLRVCCWTLFGMIISCNMSFLFLKFWGNQKQLQRWHEPPVSQPKQQPVVQQLWQHKQQQLQPKQIKQPQSPPRSAGKWRKKLLVLFVLLGIIVSAWLFWHLNEKFSLRRKETLANMCDERARMLQDQFNVSMNHVNALAILVSTFHHGKHPSAVDQKTFGEYTERTAFERPLTSGVAYALRVPHSEREKFEKQQGWTIKKMEIEDQTLVQDCIPDNLDPAPVQDEYAPVIFSQETVSHIVSIDMMSGKEDRENILRARATGKGVLTSPFKLLKSNHLGVVLTFAVYRTDLPPDATPEQRIEAAVGYLGASYDVPSLVEKLLHQLASKQTIVVNVYDTTNASAPISMYGTDALDTGLLHVSNLDFGDPLRKHEMHCRFKEKAPLPWTAISASVGVLVIFLLLGHIFHAAISRITKMEDDYQEMMELKARAEAADVAKTQFLATVSHEIRTPMNGVLGMLQMLMDTDLDATQRDYAETAHDSGKDLISLINEVLDQAKIESGRLELEDVQFDLRAVLDNVLSLFSGKSNKKGIELAVYVSAQVPEVVIGDPGRFRQIITNLVGNSIKFTQDKGHIFVSVHLGDEGHNVRDAVLQQGLNLVKDHSDNTYNTLSGFPVVDRSKSWKGFKMLNGTDMTTESETIKLLVTVEDTGVGIPIEAQPRIFTPFMQADSSTSRTYGGTGIGLSISKRLVELMHGEIGFVSECGTGSTFSFTCVFRKGETCSLDTKPQLYDMVISEFRGLRALVIDRSSIRAEVTRYHLQRLGILVDIASSLKSLCSCQASTRKSSTTSHVAMVFIDKDIWDKETSVFLQHVLKEIRQNGSADVQEKLPKVFLLATSIGSTERSELKSTGLVDRILLKPLRFSVLVACLQDTLRNGTKRQVNQKKPSTLGNLLKGKQILVVDDNRVNRRVAEGALKKYGAIVTCVESGKAALDLLKPPHDFHACFMDLQMPEMDGFEATKKIRAMEDMVNEKATSDKSSVEMFVNAARWHTPILAMTADVIQATNEQCMKCGMDGYVSKPFEEEQLYSAVAQFLESG